MSKEQDKLLNNLIAMKAALENKGQDATLVQQAIVERRAALADRSLKQELEQGELCPVVYVDFKTRKIIRVA